MPRGTIERIESACSAPRAPLSAEVASTRLAGNEGPVASALAFEAALGGASVRGFRLGLDTHRTNPPRDAHDEWLGRELQGAMVQIAYGGPRRATFWLDRRGWVHEIAPLDRLRPCAKSAEDFLAFVLGDVEPILHRGVVALAPLDAADAEAIVRFRSGCPLGDHCTRWSDDALEVLEERAALERVLAGPITVLSAPTLIALAPVLCDLLGVEPSLELVIVDDEPPRGPPPSQVLLEHPFRVPWQSERARLVLGHDRGAWVASRR